MAAPRMPKTSGKGKSGPGTKFFSGQKEVADFLWRRKRTGEAGRSEDKVVELHRYMDVAAALSDNTARVFFVLPWLIGGARGSVAIPNEVPSGGLRSPTLPGPLKRLEPFLQAVRGVAELLGAEPRASEELCWNFVRLRDVCEELGIDWATLRTWSGSHQMLAAFALLAEEHLQLTPRLGPKDFEALVQHIGYRPADQEFELDPSGLDARRVDWKRERAKVRRVLLPKLRAFLDGARLGEGLEVYAPKKHRQRRTRKSMRLP